MIALCRVLCGGKEGDGFGRVCPDQGAFSGSFLTLANGLSSRDTFSRLFRNLDPDRFRDLFQRFMAQFFERLRGVVTR
jgi:hypothetical protein